MIHDINDLIELDLYKKASTPSNSAEQHEMTMHLNNINDIITCSSSANFLSPEALGSKFCASPSNVSDGAMIAASLSTIIDVINMKKRNLKVNQMIKALVHLSCQ
jgi:hypothetical protein